MSQKSKEQLAFEATTEIVVSAVASGSTHKTGEGGAHVGEFFVEIYKKILEVVPNVND